MRIFLVEYITGGGLWSKGASALDSSLLAEGRAMIAAVATDFAALKGVEVVTLRDSRLAAFHPLGCRVVEVSSTAAERWVIERLAAEADWTLLIAPEIGGALLERCQWIEAAGGRLLSLGSELVALASNKQLTAQRLAEMEVPVPRGMVLLPGRSAGWADFPFPAVIKPLDGCGSIGVRRIESAGGIPWHPLHGPHRLEAFVPGMAVSVAVLCGPAGCFALPACQQRLTDDGTFAYLGGRLPLAAECDARARRLAVAAVSALPAPQGYLGIDLVLGEAADGSGDRVIEINPRLTTSYVGLRSLARSNLAAAMLAVAEGRDPCLRWRSEPIEFTADGTLLPVRTDAR
jgi:tyramine---L-glutamate ligase